MGIVIEFQHREDAVGHALDCPLIGAASSRDLRVRESSCDQADYVQLRVRQRGQRVVRGIGNDGQGLGLVERGFHDIEEDLRRFELTLLQERVRSRRSDRACEGRGGGERELSV